MCRVKQQRLSLATVRVYTFLYLLAVVGNQAIGCIYNHLCRTVVLLQFEYPCTAVTFGKTKDIAYISSAERVYTLRIIAHHTNCLARLCQLPHNAPLSIVRVLILIDQDIAEAFGITFEDIGVLFEKTISINQQIVKVHSICQAATLAIPLVYIVCRRNLGLFVIISQALVVLVIKGRYEPAFCCRYTFGNGIGLVYLVIELHLLYNALYKTARVALVVYCKLRIIAQVVSLATQYFREHRVESTHPKHCGSTLAHPCGNSLFHFTGSLVGKGKSQYRPRLISMFQQVGYLIGEHTSLSRPRTSYHQRRTVKIAHRVELRSVKFLFVIDHRSKKHYTATYFLRR